jgi:hypothetical protein
MPIMLEAVMHKRASRGQDGMTPSLFPILIPSSRHRSADASFHGNFLILSTDILAMPAVPQDQLCAIKVRIEEMITAPFVVFQMAALDTPSANDFTGPLIRLSRTHQRPHFRPWPIHDGLVGKSERDTHSVSICAMF